jgi:hypothetical protein
VTYNTLTLAYVVYTVLAATAASTALIFGLFFITLALTYTGTVVLDILKLMPYKLLTNIFAGFNRGHNNITNTIAAAKLAKSKIGNLLA